MAQAVERHLHTLKADFKRQRMKDVPYKLG
jgi:hypothetical protein